MNKVFKFIGQLFIVILTVRLLINCPILSHLCFAVLLIWNFVELLIKHWTNRKLYFSFESISTIIKNHGLYRLLSPGDPLPLGMALGNNIVVLIAGISFLSIIATPVGVTAFLVSFFWLYVRIIKCLIAIDNEDC